MTCSQGRCKELRFEGGKEVCLLMHNQTVMLSWRVIVMDDVSDGWFILYHSSHSLIIHRDGVWSAFHVHRKTLCQWFMWWWQWFMQVVLVHPHHHLDAVHCQLFVSCQNVFSWTVAKGWRERGWECDKRTWLQRHCHFYSIIAFKTICDRMSLIAIQIHLLNCDW